MITTSHANMNRAVSAEVRHPRDRTLDLSRVASEMVERLRRWLDPRPRQATALEMVAFAPLAPRSSPRLPEASQSPSGRGRAILVVDDEPSIRKMLVEVLKIQGYRIESVADGELALRILEDDPDIRLVLTDMVMDGMGGPEIIKYLLVNRPDLRLVCMSGTEQDEHVRGMLERNSIPFIPKPFRPSEIIRKVRQALGEEEG